MSDYVNILWYDEDLSATMKDMLTTIDYRIFICIHSTNFEKIIKDEVSDGHKILLVICHCLDPAPIISIARKEEKVVSIYILTHDSDITFENENETCYVFDKYETMEKKLLRQARLLNHQAAALNFDECSVQKSLEEITDNPEDFLFNIHSHFSPDRFQFTYDKDRLLEYCRRRYAANATQLKFIDDFDRTYQSTDAIRWYTKNCFLYPSLNSCLRKQAGKVYECDMGFFAIDLSNQIQLARRKQRDTQQVLPNAFHVYRGLNLPDAEINRFLDCIGKSITVKGFLSTSKSLDIARIFSANVVLDIKIDPTLDNIIYADISEYSYIIDEEEILIDYDTTFNIESSEFDPEHNFHTIKLVTVNHLDTILNEFISLKKKQDEDDVSIAMSLFFFGHTERACLLLKESLALCQNNDDRFDLYCELGEIYAKVGQHASAIDYLTKALNTYAHVINPYYQRLQSITFLLAIMYGCLHEHKRSFQYLDIKLDFPDPQLYAPVEGICSSWHYLPSNESSIPFEPYRCAYEHFSKFLSLEKKDKNSCGEVHFYIGLILLKTHSEAEISESLAKSLKHLKAAVRVVASKSNEFFLLSYYFIGLVYESKRRYHSAKRYYKNIVPILRCNKDRLDDLIVIYVRIAMCYSGLKMYKLAFHHFTRALNLSLQYDDPILIGTVRAHIGIINLTLQQYNEAIEQFLRVGALSGIIKRDFVNQVFRVIGEIFMKTNDESQAVTFISKFLDQNQKDDASEVYSEIWCQSCERIIDINLSKNQFDSSLFYAEKLLSFRLKESPTCLNKLVKVYLIIGICHQNSAQWQKAIDTYTTAYTILSQIKMNELAQGEDPLTSDQVVTIQSVLSNAHQQIYEYEVAIIHAKIALEAEEKRYDRNKFTIASCYDAIGWCHYMQENYSVAFEFCMKALNLLHVCDSEYHIQCCIIQHSLAAICLRRGNIEECINHCSRGLCILKLHSNYEHQRYLINEIHILLALVYQNKSNSTDITKDLMKDMLRQATIKAMLDIPNFEHLEASNANENFDDEFISIPFTDDILEFLLEQLQLATVNPSDKANFLHTIKLN